jgi:hypothetical protein
MRHDCGIPGAPPADLVQDWFLTLLRECRPYWEVDTTVRQRCRSPCRIRPRWRRS